MNLNLTGVHLDITPAIRAYVVSKLDRVNSALRPCDRRHVVLSVDKLQQKIEANVHVRGKDIHAEAIEPDMYAAIDALADKLNRQVLKYKEKMSAHRADRRSRSLSARPTQAAPPRATARAAYNFRMPKSAGGQRY